ncbi:hypothetical protein ACQCVH_21195 [Bacillus infantis]|uniref:hypothetical protein n=1 Tax=Bacillus infantis TaxID=324767 RepID=UPI003CF1E09D
MRFLIKRPPYESCRNELEAVRQIMTSGAYQFIDLLLWSAMLAIMTYPLHHSPPYALAIFLAFYAFGALLLLLLHFFMKGHSGRGQDFR